MVVSNTGRSGGEYRDMQGLENVRAYDAYNGLFLWEHKNPGAIRTGVFNNHETSNLAATDDALYVVVNETCTELDAATDRAFANLPYHYRWLNDWNVV